MFSTITDAVDVPPLPIVAPPSEIVSVAVWLATNDRPVPAVIVIVLVDAPIASLSKFSVMVILGSVCACLPPLTIVVTFAPVESAAD